MNYGHLASLRMPRLSHQDLSSVFLVRSFYRSHYCKLFKLNCASQLPSVIYTVNYYGSKQLTRGCCKQTLIRLISSSVSTRSGTKTCLFPRIVASMPSLTLPFDEADTE